MWLQHLLQESLTKFCDAFSEPKNACFVGLSSGVMTTANTNAIFGCRDAGWDILKIIPLVRLVLKSFMDAIYQSYVKLHGVIFYVEN